MSEKNIFTWDIVKNLDGEIFLGSPTIIYRKTFYSIANLIILCYVFIQEYVVF